MTELLLRDQTPLITVFHWNVQTTEQTSIGANLFGIAPVAGERFYAVDR